MRKSEPACLHCQRPVERQVGRVKQGAAAGKLAEASELADVVDVSVGMNEKLRAPAVAAQARDDLVDAVAAIHDECVFAALVGENGAVASERSDRKCLANQEPCANPRGYRNRESRR